MIVSLRARVFYKAPSKLYFNSPTLSNQPFLANTPALKTALKSRTKTAHCQPYIAYIHELFSLHIFCYITLEIHLLALGLNHGQNIIWG